MEDSQARDFGSLQQWLTEHPFITYILITASLIYIFNAVFRPRKLPLLKDALVYVLILLGGLLLMFFQTRVGLPIVHGFIVAIALMVTVRIRSWFSRRGQHRRANNSDSSQGSDSGVAEPGNNNQAR